MMNLLWFIQIEKSSVKSSNSGMLKSVARSIESISKSRSDESICAPISSSVHRGAKSQHLIHYAAHYDMMTPSDNAGSSSSSASSRASTCITLFTPKVLGASRALYDMILPRNKLSPLLCTTAAWLAISNLPRHASAYLATLGSPILAAGAAAS